MSASTDKITAKILFSDGREKLVSFPGWPDYGKFLDEHRTEIIEAHGVLQKEE